MRANNEKGVDSRINNTYYYAYTEISQSLENMQIPNHSCWARLTYPRHIRKQRALSFRNYRGSRLELAFGASNITWSLHYRHIYCVRQVHTGYPCAQFYGASATTVGCV